MAALRASTAVTETFVCLDLEGTGLYTEPQIGHTDGQPQPRPRMTELALLAVSRAPMAAAIRDQNAPRAVHCLSLLVNPGPDAVWNPRSIEISGTDTFRIALTSIKFLYATKQFLVLIEYVQCVFFNGNTYYFE